MPQRMIDSDYWSRESIQPLSWDAKAFYLYLMTNQHIKASGVYHITEKTICFDTELPGEKIQPLFTELASKVKWFKDQNIVWVMNFVYRQSRSPKFIQAVSKHLTELNLNGIAKEVIKYNMEKYDLSIPYPYRTYGVAMESSELSKTEVDKTLTKDQNKELGKICTLYEQNIGMLTPMIGERLKEIASDVPEGWFAMAVQEAVDYNKRNLRYIERILENWSVNGVKTGIRPVGEQKKTGQRRVDYHDVKEPKSG